MQTSLADVRRNPQDVFLEEYGLSLCIPAFNESGAVGETIERCLACEPALREAGEKLDGTEGEVGLDFSSVCRIDPTALRAMEEFVGVANDKGVNVVLCGVSVGVYKVLKLARLASRFSFTS